MWLSFLNSVPFQGDNGVVSLKWNVVSFKGLMLPDLISANLISGYNIVVIPDSVNGLQGTSKVRTISTERL